MTKLFDLSIAYDKETDSYCAIVNSLTDKKTVTVRDQNIRVVMSKLSRRIRQKAKDIKLFPLPHDQNHAAEVAHFASFGGSPNNTGVSDTLGLHSHVR